MPDLSTQSFLELEDVREGVLILKNREIRGVLMVSSLNFALKSEDDQAAIIYAFQSFLNSLDFSCQILIQSRKVNITPYLDSLKTLEDNQTNELLKIQTASYREFIKDLVQSEQGDAIMTKSFYVVVPYSAGPLAKKVSKKLPFLKTKEGQTAPEPAIDENFENYKNQLWQRMEFLALGLKRCGLDSIPLTTPELIELFWSLHHPEQAEIGYSPEILPELLK